MPEHLQRKRHLTLPVAGFPSVHVHRRTPPGQLFLWNLQLDRTVRDVDGDRVTVLDQADHPAGCRLR